MLCAPNVLPSTPENSGRGPSCNIAMRRTRLDLDGHTVTDTWVRGLCGAASLAYSAAAAVTLASSQ